MRIPGQRVLVIGATAAAVLVAAPGLAWLSWTHTPTFYRSRMSVPPAERQAEARKFVAQSLQLRNDIANEPSWEAIFRDDEVNAWLAEDLVTHFADQIPPGVHDPRVVFEMDRVTLAFGLDQGGLRSIVWVVARPRVAGPNVLELTLEKVRAGMLPIPAEQVLDRITAHARARGLDVSWKRDGEDHLPVATIRYTPNAGRDDVRLDRLLVVNGEIHLAGHSDRSRGALASPTLPTRRALQSRFPRQNTQLAEPPPATARRNTSNPPN